MHKLRLPTKDFSEIPEYYSSEGQDAFVLSCLDGKRDGTFLDIGAAWPKLNNNTFLLEKQFGWTGVCVEIMPEVIQSYIDEQRTAKLFIQDATTLDYDNIINLLGTSKIDYLSLDLEPASVTYKCLTSIPFDRIEFGVITFEHDAYRHGEQWKQESRRLLLDAGYHLLCANVGTNGSNCGFEDWYIHPTRVDATRVFQLMAINKEGRRIVFDL
jgi:hypothetical protein